jgi:hypothetical protein
VISPPNSASSRRGSGSIFGTANSTPAACAAGSTPIEARLAESPSACGHTGSPVDSSCPSYSGRANASARSTSASFEASCGRSCTTETMLLL